MKRTVAALTIAWSLLPCSGVASGNAAGAEATVSEPVPESAALPAAQRAVRAYRALPAAERERLRGELSDHVQSLESWLAAVNAGAPAILCIGENHGAPARHFLAERVFPLLQVDHLVLETTARRALWIATRVRAGDAPIRLLGADIARPLAAALANNPGLVVHGFEDLQASADEATMAARGASRDERIARRLRAGQAAGERYVVLYGGLHCADWPLWMFHYLRSAAPDSGADMRSVRLIGDRQDPSIEAFAAFLRAIDVAGDPFVLVRTEALPDPLRDWFPLLNQYLFEPFDTLIVHGLDARPERLAPRLQAAEHEAGSFPHWTAGGVTRKPSTDAPAVSARRSQWMDWTVTGRPSTADRGLSLRGDVFPHRGWELPGGKPSTGELDLTGGGDIFPHVGWEAPTGAASGRVLSPRSGDSRPRD